MNIPAKPWTKDTPPKRILAIRLQAMGDLVITLPYLQALRNNLPVTTQLDLLTRKEVDPIPRSLHLFDKIYSIGGGRNFKKQLPLSLLMLPGLWLRRYDMVLDLQNNLISRITRKAIKPLAWSQFDKTSPVAAGERTRLTIEAAGLGAIELGSPFALRRDLAPGDVASGDPTPGDPASGDPAPAKLLKENGWDGSSRIVLLNPAGAFETRNWPMENYVGFARLWLQQFPQTQFLVTGVALISSKADYLKEQLQDKLIRLIDKTTPAEAFAIIQQVTLVLSEDSGLMHMAWVSGVPTLALFGGTRGDWSRPLGARSLLLDSSDLPCGSCMQEYCRFGDVHCLSRYSPPTVFRHAVSLLEKTKNQETC
jgi:heptosyltransferase-2